MEVFSPQSRCASAAAAIAASSSPSEMSGYSFSVSPVAGLTTAYLPNALLLLRSWRSRLIVSVRRFQSVGDRVRGRCAGAVGARSAARRHPDPQDLVGRRVLGPDSVG